MCFVALYRLWQLADLGAASLRFTSNAVPSPLHSTTNWDGALRSISCEQTAQGLMAASIFCFGWHFFESHPPLCIAWLFGSDFT
jgi:hypothetical protein